MRADTKARWASADWHASTAAWILDAMAAAGIRQTGPIEQPRVRFWSTQLTIATSGGRLWFKENNPGQAFEARLVADLARLVPEHVVPPVAVDAERGWLLSPDQGPTMYARGDNDRAQWSRVVADFADVQRRLVDHEAVLRATGLPDVEPRQSSDLVRAVVAASRARPTSDPRHVDAELADRVEDALRRLDLLAGVLQAGAVRSSLEHNDLHANNTFVPRAGQPLRFFDFGDSLWAHPFISMAVPVEHMAAGWDVSPHAPDVQYVLDAYLERWSDVASAGELRELMRAALPFGQAHRLMSWNTVLEFADADGLAEFGGAIPGWLDRLVHELAD